MSIDLSKLKLRNRYLLDTALDSHYKLYPDSDEPLLFFNNNFIPLKNYIKDTINITVDEPEKAYSKYPNYNSPSIIYKGQVVKLTDLNINKYSKGDGTIQTPIIDNEALGTYTLNSDIINNADVTWTCNTSDCTISGNSFNNNTSATCNVTFNEPGTYTVIASTEHDTFLWLTTILDVIMSVSTTELIVPLTDTVKFTVLTNQSGYIAKSTNSNITVTQDGNIVNVKGVTLGTSKVNITSGKKTITVNVTITPGVTISKSMVQDSELTLFPSDLLTTAYKNYKFSKITIDEEDSYSIESDGSRATYKTSAKAGTDKRFVIQFVNPSNSTQVYNVVVLVNITRLPTIYGYFYTNLQDLTNHINTYVPPSMTQVFNSWARFADGTNYYPSGSTFSGMAAKWQLIEGGFESTANVAKLAGFISPDEFTDYQMECTVSSTSDNDVIALVMAYRYHNGVNEALIAARDGGTTSNKTPTNRTSTSGDNLPCTYGWCLCYIVNNTRYILAEPISKFPTERRSWSGAKSRIRITRQNNIFSAMCTKYFTGDTVPDLEPTSYIELDVTKSNGLVDLSWLNNTPSPYGYSCLSNPNSTFINTVFSGDGEVDYSHCYSIQDGKVYEYKNGKWVQTEVTVQDQYGYPRYVVNPDTERKFEILENEALEVPLNVEISTSKSNVSMLVNSESSFEVITNYRSFYVSCSNIEVCTARISGNTVYVKGISTGTATVTVIADDKSAVVSCNVVEKTSYIPSFNVGTVINDDTKMQEIKNNFTFTFDKQFSENGIINVPAGKYLILMPFFWSSGSITTEGVLKIGENSFNFRVDSANNQCIYSGQDQNIHTNSNIWGTNVYTESQNIMYAVYAPFDQDIDITIDLGTIKTTNNFNLWIDCYMA